MQVQENVSLKQYNTFGIEAAARWFSSFASQHELQELLALQQQKSTNRLILGGGSNMLLTKDVDGIVMKNEVKGIEVVNEDNEFIYLRSGAGENWHQLVQYAVQQNWGGLENLSLIPGNVGASPMQNIGAYGVEIKEVMHELQAWHIHDQQLVNFSNADCAFGYRESVFKRKLKNEFVILNVTYKLCKQPVYHISYGAIQQELEKMGVKELSVKAISEAVIQIRSSKLPDPKVTGNAGSFFKNPSVSVNQYQQLKREFPEIVAYPNADGTFKLAAGWLIEQCGWKGYRKGDAGCHAKQALVLVNYGSAAGSEIVALSKEITASVQEKFQVALETEVNII